MPTDFPLSEFTSKYSTYHQKPEYVKFPPVLLKMEAINTNCINHTIWYSKFVGLDWTCAPTQQHQTALSSYCPL